jgi:PadR family transcriptional regulator PadR
MTAPLERVLRAFLEDPAAPRYGYDLMKAAGLKSGTLYPMLGRLEDDRLVTSAWETPQQDGQRPRKYYRLTGEGIRAARLELAQVSASRSRAPGRYSRPDHHLWPGDLHRGLGEDPAGVDWLRDRVVPRLPGSLRLPQEAG